MKFELVRFGDHFRLVKGASYSSKNLVEESDTGLLTINAFLAGGGYKPQSEKPFHGDVRAEHLLSNGDVLIAMTEQDEGLLGSPLVVHKGRTDYEDLLFSLDVAKPIATTGEIEPEFVFNVLRIPAFRKRAAYGDTGSTVQRLPYDAIGDFKIPKPPLPTQRAINRLAAAIDKKIWLNSRMADNLEKLSESVFKSWFIDFDPVKAKMAGEVPVGIDAETAALFPDSLEESALGEIPSGWVAQPLDSIADYLNGLALQKFPVVDDSDVLPVIKIAQLRAAHTRGADFASGTLDPRYVVEDGDILFSWSGTLEVEYWTGGRGALNQHLFKVSGNTVPDWFAYFATRSFLGEFRAIASSKATTMGHIQRRHLTEALLAVPPNDVLEQASRFIGPIVSLRTDLLKQNTTLGKLRDSLLPRLISGELEIPDEMLAA